MKAPQARHRQADVAGLFTDDATPTGLWISMGWRFYKDGAPTALRIRANSRFAEFLGAMLR